MGTCTDVRRELKRIGLLLLQDKKLPSVVGIITGQSLSTSWWSHRRGQEIFNCLQALEKDAITANLVGGKVTFVHKRLWPALVTVGSAAAAAPGRRAPLPTREARQRLLAYAEEVHTDKGRHEIRLQPWAEFARQRGIVTIDPDEARAEIEAAAVVLGSTPRSLPWHRFAKR